MKKFFNAPKKDVTLLSLSPCQFKLMERNRGTEKSGIDDVVSHSSLKRKDVSSNMNLFPNTNVKGLWQHEEILSNLSGEIYENGARNSAKYTTALEKFLIQSWLIGQVNEVNLHIGKKEVNSMVLTSETLLHFEVIDRKSGRELNESFVRGGSSEKGGANREYTIEFLYLLTATFSESFHDGLHDTYEIVLNTKDKNGNDLHDLDLALGNVELTDRVTLESPLESNFSKTFNLALSSLTWMEKASSDIINRRYFNLYRLSSNMIIYCSYQH